MEPTFLNAKKKPTYRVLRVGEVVRRVLAPILQDIGSFTAQVESITITEVRMSADLRHATVFVAPTSHEESHILGILERSHSALRKLMAHELGLRIVPLLKFKLDRSFYTAEKIARLLKDPKVTQDL